MEDRPWVKLTIIVETEEGIIQIARLPKCRITTEIDEPEKGWGRHLWPDVHYPTVRIDPYPNERGHLHYAWIVGDELDEPEIALARDRVDFLAGETTP